MTALRLLDFRFVIGFLLAGALIAALLMISGAARAADHCVKAGESIQAAINNASNGDTICVEAGTYEEQIVINQDLDLVGQPGVTVQAPEDLDFYNVPENDADYAPIVGAIGGTIGDGEDVDWEVTGADTIEVNISGLAIRGNEEGPSGRYAAIFARNANGSIQDNDVDKIFFGGRVSLGVMVYGDSELDILNNELRGHVRAGIAANGDFGESPAPDVSIRENDVTGPGWPDSGWAANGIQIGWGATGEMIGNTVRDHGYVGAYPGALLAMGASNVLIADNNAYNNTDGIQIAGDLWFGSNLGASNIVVTDNVVENNINGLSVGPGSENITASGNVILENEVGVELWGGFDAGELSLNQNTISGNEVGVLNGYGETLDATNNYWGHASGPGGEDGRTNPAGRQVGKGDAIVGDVDFSDWLRQSIHHPSRK